MTSFEDKMVELMEQMTNRLDVMHNNILINKLMIESIDTRLKKLEQDNDINALKKQFNDLEIMNNFNSIKIRENETFVDNMLQLMQQNINAMTKIQKHPCVIDVELTIKDETIIEKIRKTTFYRIIECSALSKGDCDKFVRLFDSFDGLIEKFDIETSYVFHDSDINKWTTKTYRFYGILKKEIKNNDFEINNEHYRKYNKLSDIIKVSKKLNQLVVDLEEFNHSYISINGPFGIKIRIFMKPNVNFSLSYEINFSSAKNKIPSVSYSDDKLNEKLKEMHRSNNMKNYLVDNGYRRVHSAQINGKIMSMWYQYSSLIVMFKSYQYEWTVSSCIPLDDQI